VATTLLVVFVYYVVTSPTSDRICRVHCSCILWDNFEIWWNYNLQHLFFGIWIF